ncbi:reverse transcriptase domain-containing protein [Cellulosimicrobium funkei]|uniref:reverse transcriptase domain-containing protein n=1 Tax=Cellulosimicrobium funkei TaxID=264251 RepID=UPI0012E11B4A|nr:reverse transcriptase domain-containing protein [Cellulosimicrobium funkei]
MKLDAKQVSALDLRGAAEMVVQRPMEQMPPLISDLALSDAVDALAKSAAAVGQQEVPFASESIGMPKRGLGPRVITVLPPDVRALYSALVGSVEDACPEPSRGKDWDVHQLYGAAVGSKKLLLDFDIAACYEYIDHEILYEELAAATMDPPKARAIVDTLGAIFGRPRGLPQAVDASHTLSDLYLSRLERTLLHAGFDVERFADDFRLVVDGWAAAHDTLEFVSGLSRGVGLILADSKTRIQSSVQVFAEFAERQRVLNDLKTEVSDELTSLSFVASGYDDWEVVELPPDDSVVNEAALRRVVELWADGPPWENKGTVSKLGSNALQVLSAQSIRVENSHLFTIANREPIRLWNVLRYCIARESESTENWDLLARLSGLERQSPWLRLWLLHVASMQSEPPTGSAASAFDEWAISLTADRHETVRCAAAWHLATRRRIDVGQIADLFKDATKTSRIGLAAAAGQIRSSGNGSTKIENAIRNWSPLTKAAFEWGVKFDSNVSG